MKYFYDTEFLENGLDIDLISIGIVAEDGREYYAVNSEVNENLNQGDLGTRISKHDWLMENVVPHLPLRTEPTKYTTGGRSWMPPHLDMRDTRVKPKWVIANEVREFLTSESEDRDDNELWAYFAAYDHVALCQLWGPMIRLPKGVPMWTHDLKQEMDRLGYTPDHEGIPEQVDAHDALADAAWNLAVHEFLCGRALTGEG